MKAIVKRERAPGLWMEEVPIPKIKPHEVLIKPHKTAICGTDIHIYKWDAWSQKRLPVPLVVGHEFMGEVVEVGSQVQTVKVGDRVSGEGHLVCGLCKFCASGRAHLCPETKVIGIDTHGCFAEYFPLPAFNVFKIPPGVPEEVSAIFDPFGNATHTLLSFNLLGEDVLITGAGPIGLMGVAIAKFAGARNVVITDILDYRLDLAKKLGATATVNVSKETLSQVMKKHHIDGFSVGFEMAGSHQALHTLLENLATGGKAALLGILPPGGTVDWDLVIFKMLTIKGIYGREIFSTWHQMSQMLQGGLNITPVITHRFEADDFQKGFDVMLSGQSGKVILNWEQKKAAEVVPPKEKTA